MACREGYRRLGDTGTNLEDVLVVDLLIATSALLHLTHLPLDSGGGRHYHVWWRGETEDNCGHVCILPRIEMRLTGARQGKGRLSQPVVARDYILTG